MELFFCLNLTQFLNKKNYIPYKTPFNIHQIMHNKPLKFINFDLFQKLNITTVKY